ncbi:MAG: peptidoglycan-binding domain-containing protein, partial [Chthoniobacterales bacterium]
WYPYYWDSPYDYGYNYYPYSYGYSNYGQPAYGYTSDSVVQQVQSQLADEGYYRGAVDGVIGPQTRTAIRAYESRHRMPIDGAISNDLLSTMGLR